MHLLPQSLIAQELCNTNLVWDERFRGGVPFIPVLKPYHGVYMAATL